VATKPIQVGFDKPAKENGAAGQRKWCHPNGEKEEVGNNI